MDLFSTLPSPPPVIPRIVVPFPPRSAFQAPEFQRRADLAAGRRDALPSKRTLARLRSAHAAVAKLVIGDAIYAPIFERLEIEIAIVEAELSVDDPIARAKAIVAAQKALRPT